MKERAMVFEPPEGRIAVMNKRRLVYEDTDYTKTGKAIADVIILVSERRQNKSRTGKQGER
jgi:hypothetical protein